MDLFDMGIEMDMGLSKIRSTHAEVNYDSLTGSFCLPGREAHGEDSARFAFALDEKGVVFIDDGDTALSIIRRIRQTKLWKLPSIERFLYDFLEQIIHDDADELSRYELELNGLENDLGQTGDQKHLHRLNDIRSSVRDMRMHYEQLLDLGQELEENENCFFSADNLRYFHLFNARIAVLRDMAAFVWDYTVQVRDYYESQMDLKQNRIMALLGIRGRNLSPSETKHLEQWLEMGFPDDVIYAAYDRTTTKLGALNWAYMSGILRKWHAAGLHDLPQIEEAEGKRRHRDPRGGHGDPVDPNELEDFMEK